MAHSPQLTKVTFDHGQRSILSLSNALMFALSTDNNNTLLPNTPLTMNTSLSLLAALFLSIVSTTAFASPNAMVKLNQDHTTDVQMDQTRDGEVTLQVLAVTPGGSTKRIQSRHRNMNDALGAYQRFVSTLPYGSRIVRVAFLGSDGQIIFSHQG